jgi:hypothetical protein
LLIGDGMDGGVGLEELEGGLAPTDPDQGLDRLIPPAGGAEGGDLLMRPLVGLPSAQQVPALGLPHGRDRQLGGFRCRAASPRRSDGSPP